MRRRDDREPIETREQVDGLNRQAMDLAFHESARSFQIARRAEALARRLDYASVAYSQSAQAYFYFQAGRHEEALDVAAKAFDFFERAKDSSGQARVFSCLSRLHWSLGDYEKAIWNGHRALELCEAREDLPDTGRGIPRDRLERIFDVGFSEKESRVRMHVGLSNVQTIVRRHGGSVEVASELGKGTAFTIRLPCEQSPSHLGT